MNLECGTSLEPVLAKIQPAKLRRTPATVDWPGAPSSITSSLTARAEKVDLPGWRPIDMASCANDCTAVLITIAHCRASSAVAADSGNVCGAVSLSKPLPFGTLRVPCTSMGNNGVLLLLRTTAFDCRFAFRVLTLRCALSIASLFCSASAKASSHPNTSLEFANKHGYSYSSGCIRGRKAVGYLRGRRTLSSAHGRGLRFLQILISLENDQH
jgi:hypothetical protein